MTDQYIEIHPVALGHYSDPGLPPLDDVDAEVTTLAELLADFSGVVTDWLVPMEDRGSDAVEARLSDWSSSEHPFSVLYWVGHASANRAAPRLQHARSHERENRPGVSADRMAGAIAPRSRDTGDHWHIVVIDTCWSAAFVQQVSAAVDAMPGRRRFLLIGTSGDGSTTLGRFTSALRSVLRHSFGASDRISLWDLASELRRTLPRAEVVPKKITDDAALHRTAPLTGAPLDVIDEINAVLADLSADERGHFIPKAQGGELGELAWYFQGRRTESERITNWLATHDHGVLAVAGAAGSGKSALLGNLLAQTRPRLRSVLTRHRLITELTPAQRPPDNTFTVVLHLTGLSTQDAVVQIAADLALDGPDPAATLTERLDHLLADVAHSAPLTILADALDEAVDPLTVANALLRRLGALDGVRVVVGTRRDTSEGPDQPPSKRRNLLDALRANRIITLTRDPTAIGRYVVSRLTTAFGYTDAINDTAIAIGVSSHEFLFARLAVHEILAAGTPPTGTAVDDLLSTDHRGLFRRAVTRLSHAHPASTPVLRALAHAQGRGLPVSDGVCALTATALASQTISDAEVHAVLDAAAPYVLLDTDHSQTVYRLAHRTFAKHFTADAHLAITAAMTNYLAEAPEQSANSYLAHHLSGHAGYAGEQAWILLGHHPGVLDRLDPASVAADAWRTAFGRHPLPPAIAGVIGASHQLITAVPSERPGIRQLAMTRHTATRDIHRHEPPPHDQRAWHVRWAALVSAQTHRTLAGHAGGVLAVVAVPLPDGRTLLAAGGLDGTVRLWDPVTGRLVRDVLTGHINKNWAMTVVPWPDGRTLLATGSGDGEVRLWDPVTGRLVRDVLTGHINKNWAMTVVPWPDGRSLLATASGDGTVQMWDPVTGHPVGNPFTGHTYKNWAMLAVPWPDGRSLLATASGDGTVQMWDPVTGHPVGNPFTGHTYKNWLMTVVPWPDGRSLLATGSGDGRGMRFWDPVTGHPVGHPLAGHTFDVWAMTVVPLPDGRTLLATGSEDGTVRLLDPVTGHPVGNPLAGHIGLVQAMAAVPLPDGRTLLATGSLDGTVRLWDPVIGNSLSGYTRSAGEVSAMTALPSPDGRTLLVAVGGLDGRVQLWDPVTGNPASDVLTSHTYSVAAVELPDGRTLLATGGLDGTVQLWDPETSHPVGHPRASHTDRVLKMAAVPLPEGRTLLATASGDGTVRLWDPVTGHPVGSPLAGHNNKVRAMTALPWPDGRTLLATGGLDGTVRLWDPVTQAQLKVIVVSKPVHTIAPLPEGAIAVALEDGLAVLSVGMV
ncbi:WD40 repeat domain-containing protein [Amycolatopsis sp. BJA-103]|uniref:nSTAND1 domain-containing NTPase n=1 Tax=Amycolatopsis sp. BJA-103 TaxID=1911175 RepID=UPI000C9C9035|nr:WD40 repeat domain-containing protein [Amycolatopsis sp. BJA-103]PNE16421.1 hypothetical protein B1H26_24455 [Amycolatopsis sp. BJA-103]